MEREREDVNRTGKRKGMESRVENPAKQKSKKLLRTEPERRERKNKCMGDVEHMEIYLICYVWEREK